HVGTLGAVVVVFRREIASLILEFLSLPRTIGSTGSLVSAWRNRPHFRMLVLIVTGSIPTALIGFFFKDLFESLFASITAVGLALLFTGLFLFLTRFKPPAGRDILKFRTSDALLVGLAQGLAITPGVSRSGFTMSVGLFLGLDREISARYSFLLSIPAILGALALELRHVESGALGLAEMGTGLAAAFLSGWLTLIFLLRLVKRGRLHYFSYYCWLIGLAALTLSLVTG
ncbi:MAG: undecaprenyl-diphosphate phosphatase, partial [Pseudomonadota bacterium]